MTETDGERLSRIKREIGNPHFNMRRLSIECGDLFWLLARLEAAEKRELPDPPANEIAPAVTEAKSTTGSSADSPNGTVAT